ncbi:MAG: PEGA domain-containing protein [Pseudomonadota bacterium]|nr:MAG: hypothetical protein DIU78_25460 [Pseudomonadota bacterium]
MSLRPQRFARRALVASLLAFAAACTHGAGRAAVSLRLVRKRGAPRDAGVWIDEEYIGPLSYVAARGVRLPVGKHRITVRKAGYFPWDRMVEADREPIVLDVTLDPIPD